MSSLQCIFDLNLLLASFARSVRQVMDRHFPLPFMAQARARGPCTKTRKEKKLAVRTEQTKLVRLFIISLCWLFRERDEIVWRFTSDQELEIRVATYGPELIITIREISQPYNNHPYYIMYVLHVPFINGKAIVLYFTVSFCWLVLAFKVIKNL